MFDQKQRIMHLFLIKWWGSSMGCWIENPLGGCEDVINQLNLAETFDMLDCHQLAKAVAVRFESALCNLIERGVRIKVIVRRGNQQVSMLVGSVADDFLVNLYRKGVEDFISCDPECGSKAKKFFRWDNFAMADESFRGVLARLAKA